MESNEGPLGPQWRGCVCPHALWRIRRELEKRSKRVPRSGPTRFLGSASAEARQLARRSGGPRRRTRHARLYARTHHGRAVAHGMASGAWRRMRPNGTLGAPVAEKSAWPPIALNAILPDPFARTSHHTSKRPADVVSLYTATTYAIRRVARNAMRSARTGAYNRDIINAHCRD